MCFRLLLYLVSATPEKGSNISSFGPTTLLFAASTCCTQLMFWGRGGGASWKKSVYHRRNMVLTSLATCEIGKSHTPNVCVFHCCKNIRSILFVPILQKTTFF